MKKLPILYKRTKTGATQQWQIIVDGEGFYTIEGQLNGTLTTSKPRICKGKNTGKSNETTAEEQALLEAQSKMDKKLKCGGYFLKLDDIDNDRGYFEPMLAHKLKDYKNKINISDYLASRKINGHRMTNVLGAIKTRKGEDYKSCPHISKALEPFFKKYPNGMVDGEIYSHGQDFEKVSSLVRTQKPTEEDLIESEKLCKLWIFDGIVDDPEEGFVNRFERLKKAIRETIDEKTINKYFTFVENVVINSYEDAMAEHDKYVEEGFEGLILREKNAPYYNKRSKSLLKYKSFIDEEFTLLDILEAEGNRSGMAGKVVVQLKDGTTSEAGIKGGEEFYKNLWLNKKKYIGKYVTVRYQNYTRYGKLNFGVAIEFDPFDK